MRPKIILLLAFLLLALGWQSSRAQEIHRAGLVVRFGDGSVVTSCVQFTQESVSGADILRFSGLEVVMSPSSSMGVAVCKISAGLHSDGCPPDDCFCQCRGVDCVYWAYYHLKNNAWEYSGRGASHYQVRDGDVEGWAWGPGAPGGGSSDAQPPIIPFDQICIVDTPTPTDTPTPGAPTATPTASPTPTPTPTFTATPIPSNTPTPTDTPTATPIPTPTPTLPPNVTPTATFTPRPSITIDFLLTPDEIAPGACAQLQWTIRNADAAFLDDGGGEKTVPLTSERQVCPASDTTYTLRAQRPDAQQSEARTLRVIVPAASPTVTAAPTPASQPEGAPTPGLAPTPTQYTVANPHAGVPVNATPTPFSEVYEEAVTKVMNIGELTTTATPEPAGPTFQPIQRLTPAPEPGENASGKLLPLGGFALILALILLGGAWALRRQSR